MEEKKIGVCYKITRYENGDIDVENVEVEGATQLSDEGIYKDIEDVARIINLTRIENASYTGVRRFYAEVAAAQQQAAQQEQAPADGTIAD